MNKIEKSFTCSQEVKDWFKSKGYKIPTVFERSADWKLQWKTDGDTTIANCIAEDLRRDGFVVDHVFGSDIPDYVKMQITVMKSTETTDIEKIKLTCSEELYIGTPTVKELREEYKLTWKTKMADDYGLKNKKDILSTRYDVIEGCITYEGRIKHPSGYCIRIKK